MKKKFLTTLVSLLASSGALAQTNVSIYGVADAGVSYTKFKRDVAGSTWGLDSGGAGASRIGVRGSEALGDGLSAQFSLESGYNLDTGGLGFNGRLFGRQAWVGLDSKALGTVAFGRIPAFSSGTGSFDMWANIDPFRTSWGLASSNNTFSSGGLRLDNTVLYRSAVYGGLQAGLLYSFSSSPTAVAIENAGSRNNNRTAAIGASFTGGPLYAMISYDLVKPASITTGPLAGRTNPNEKHLQVGVTYDFGVIKLHGGYAKQSNQSIYSPVASDLSASSTFDPLAKPDADSYLLGITASIGSGKLLTSYQYRNGRRFGTTAGAAYEADRRVLSVGYLHALSKRTSVYASASDSIGRRSINEGTAATDPFNRREFRMGVNHTF